MGLSAQMAAFFDELRRIQDLRGGKILLGTHGPYTDSNYGVKAAYAAGSAAAPRVAGLASSQLGNRGALQQAVKRVSDAQSVGKTTGVTTNLGKAVPRGPKLKMPGGGGPGTPPVAGST